MTGFWRRRYAHALIAAVMLSALACGPRGGAQAGRAIGSATDTSAGAPPRRARPDEAQPRIVALGDSLTAGLGLSPDQAYPALLQERLDAEGLSYEVVNAGVSGDTSAGGVRRLDWSLEGDVRVLIVALGANDGLRGLPLEELRRNLSSIIEEAQARGITVILAGMEAPPNFGRDYVVAFRRVYPALAEHYRVAFVPFLLQGVAGDDALNQPDGIHPTVAGARIVADNVWAILKPLVERAARTATTAKGTPAGARAAMERR